MSKIQGNNNASQPGRVAGHSHTGTQKQEVRKTAAADFSKKLNTENDNELDEATSAGGIAAKSSHPRPVPDKVFMVNNLVNFNYSYESDSQQFQMPDYWQTPQEMQNRLKGDCEDFAILKYDILLKKGISEEQLELAYAKLDGQAHLVTLYTAHDGHTHVLDNAVKQIETIEQRENLKVLVKFKMKDVVYGENGWHKVLANIRNKDN